MSSPPAVRRETRTTFREVGKQARAFERGRSVRVVSESGYFIRQLDRERDAGVIERLLAAPNAMPVRKHGGELTGIQLLSVGDDRGHSGERHGRSTVTTERVRNDQGFYVGGSWHLQHKSNPEQTARWNGGGL